MKLRPYPTFLIIVSEIRLINSMVEKMIAVSRKESSAKSINRKQTNAIKRGPIYDIDCSMYITV